MKTAHYTFTTWNESAMASGFGGAGAIQQSSLILEREAPRKARSLGGDNVIDLAAWRAANLVETAEEFETPDWAEEGEEWEEREAEPELAIPAPRPRKSRRTAVLSELISTAGVAAAALAIILRVVAF